MTAATKTRKKAAPAAKKAPILGVIEPRLWTRPLRELTRETTRGFEVVDFAEQILEIHLFEWQKWWLIHALEINEDGTYRFKVVLLIVGRQNGKSMLLTVLALWAMVMCEVPLVLGTAHNLPLAEAQWAAVVDMAKAIDEIYEMFDGSEVKTNGQKTLNLRTSDGISSYLATSLLDAGRGRTADLVLLDELRKHRDFEAWAAISPTTTARPNGQIVAASNAGNPDSIVLIELRNAAMKALEDGSDMDPENTTAIFEWSAPQKADLMDRQAWAAANPSLGRGTVTERDLAGKAKLAANSLELEWKFRNESMGQWKPTAGFGPFTPGAWDRGIDEASHRATGATVAACIDMSWNRSHCHVAIAALRDDGQVHTEVIASRAGSDWVKEWLAARKDTFTSVALMSNAPVASLKDDLIDAGVPVTDWNGPDVGKACGNVFDLVKSGGLFHRSQDILDLPAGTAATKAAGSDAWVIDRVKSPVDASPLVAVIGAVWALGKAPTPKTSIYESQGLRVV